MSTPADEEAPVNEALREKARKDIKARHTRYVNRHLVLWFVMVVLLVLAWFAVGTAVTLLLAIIAVRVEDVCSAYAMTAEITEDVSKKLHEDRMATLKALMPGVDADKDTSP